MMKVLQVQITSENNLLGLELCLLNMQPASYRKRRNYCMQLPFENETTSTKSLSWNVHVHKLCKKIAAGIGVLKRSRDFVSFDTLQNTCMYNSLVQPHFDYCSEIWGCSNKTLFIKLQKLQNEAAHILKL